jgi:uncharacterized protein YndB with AHSA1/START domain
MTAHIGPNHRLSVAKTLRSQTHALYAGALGATAAPVRADVEIFTFGNGAGIGVFYVDDVLSPAQHQHALWIELVVDDIPQTVARLTELGMRPFDYFDKAHHYFQAPGGQVFRLASHLETARGRAIGDGAGTIVATIDVAAAPERAIDALTTKDVETWWGAPDLYRFVDWRADRKVGGSWHVIVRMNGQDLPAGGTFLAVAPREVVQTRRYDWDHPTLGRRDTTVTYRCAPITGGTRMIVVHTGFAGAPTAEAEHAVGWERTLDFLARYLRS